MINELLKIIHEAEAMIEQQNRLCDDFETKLNSVYVDLLEIQHRLNENKLNHEYNFQKRETNT